MKIGIEANDLTLSYYSGSKTYAENLINSLAKIDKVNKYVIFASKKVSIPRQHNFRLKVTPRLLFFSKRQFLLSQFVKKEKVDVFHYLVPYGDVLLNHPKIVTTVHDLNLKLTYPFNSRFFFKRLICEFTRKFILSKTRIFITPTQTIKRELSEYLSKNKQNKPIYVTYEGVDKQFKIINTKGTKKSYFLCMGDFAIRKNIHRIFKAYSMLSRKIQENYSLTVVTSTTLSAKRFLHLAKSYNIDKKLKIVTNPSKVELVKLYNNAKCFVWPSLYEGFGLPLLEAMACGCTVITSNYGAMKEVTNNSSILVNPRSIRQISKALKKIVLSPEITNKLRLSGLRRIKRFTWSNTAKQTLKAYSLCYKSK